MRAIIFILILAVVAIIAAIATGFLDISQTRSAQAPDVDASRNGVSASGGQVPAFDIETGSVEVGTTEATVEVPTVQVNPPANEAQPATNGAATP